MAPWLFGKLIETSATSVFYGYLIGASFMLIGAIVELFLGLNAERLSLEHIAQHAAAGEWMFQMQFIHATHQRQIRCARLLRPIVRRRARQ